MNQRCKLPPRGWWCSRDAGHAGPCPTYPTGFTFVWRKLTGRPV